MIIETVGEPIYMSATKFRGLWLDTGDWVYGYFVKEK